MNTTRTGEKGIDFDILAGQDVQLNTEIMEMLERSAINATGVPSVIMNYINEADYAKSLVMGNVKFLGRVLNHQLSFNDGITELYKKMASFTTNMPPEIIKSMEFSLNPPRTLNSVNMNDLINNSDQVITFMTETLVGKNADPGEDGSVIKDLLYKKLAKEHLPMLPWGRVEELFSGVKLEVQALKLEKKATAADDDTDSET